MGLAAEEEHGSEKERRQEGQGEEGEEGGSEARRDRYVQRTRASPVLLSSAACTVHAYGLETITLEPKQYSYEYK